MKKFVFIYHSSTAPDPSKQQLWMDWFASVGDKFVDAGNPLMGGVHVTESGTQQLDGSDTTAGYSIVSAENIDEAEKLALGCPNQDICIYEALPM